MRRLLSLVFCFAAATLTAAPPEQRRILFLGDSITYAGTYIQIIEAALIAQHPDKEYELLNLGLASETVSGLSEEGHAGGKFPRPNLHERLDRVLAAVKPQLVIACYGMNCGIYHPLSEERARAYQQGIARLREKAAAIGASVLHLTPPVFDPAPIAARLLPAGLDAYPQPYSGYNDVLSAYAQWLLDQRAQGWQVLDVHNAMKTALAAARGADPAFTFAKDGVHPDAAGHLVMARPLLEHWGLKTTADGLPDHAFGADIFNLIKQKQTLLRDAWLTETRHLRPGVKAGLPLSEAQAKARELDAKARELARAAQSAAFSGTVSEWQGFTRHDFTTQAGLSAVVVAPRQAAPGRPWVWHGEFFGHKPTPDVALLARGFHIAYLKVPDLLGSPQAVMHWNGFYAEMTGRYGLAAKAALVGLSRGGLYCYNWAAANPGKVSCIYADAPVCDFKSWPGGKGKGKGDPKNWERVLKLWAFPDEAAALAARVNPVDNLAPLAKAGVPLLHVYGDDDEVVPWEENTGVIAERYRALGGSITLIAKHGIGHHPHGLEDSAPIVEFIARHAAR
ncbi:MAG TPA: hypothetical protein DIT64_02930 [Verrucomicrobiales bacterium]|nr:hypothetical protein [Verrucomicrobiales bacterium]